MFIKSSLLVEQSSSVLYTNAKLADFITYVAIDKYVDKVWYMQPYDPHLSCSP